MLDMNELLRAVIFLLEKPHLFAIDTEGTADKT